MLVGEVGGIGRDGPRLVLPGELGVQDVAIAQPVAQRAILEQRRPLRPDMAEIQAGNDLVAGADGLMVAAKGADKRGASLKLSPAPASVLARFDRVPVVASD